MPMSKKPTPGQIVSLWDHTGGKAWEPREPASPLVLGLIEAGYARRVDGRCGFEKIKDAMLAWTDAGRMAALGLKFNAAFRALLEFEAANPSNVGQQWEKLFYAREDADNALRTEMAALVAKLTPVQIEEGEREAARG